MKAKERHEIKIVEYLADPDNKFANRKYLALTVCGISVVAFYNHFTPEELSDLEKRALRLRRSKYASLLAKVDKSLLKEAAKGDIAAAKLAYQRFEGWSEKQKHELSGPDGGPITTVERIIIRPGKKK